MAIPVEKLLLQGKHYYDSNQAEKVINFFEKNAKYLLEEPQFWWYRAWAYLDLDQIEKSQGAALKGLAIDPDNINLLYYAGMTYFSQDNVKKAETYFQQCITINPDNSTGYGGMILVAAYQNDRESYAHYEQVSLSNWPESIYILTMLLRAEYKWNNHKKLEKYCYQKLALQPDDDQANRLLGWLAYKTGDVDLAEKRFNTAIRTNSEHSYTQSMLRKIRKQKVDEATILIRRKKMEHTFPFMKWVYKKLDDE